MSFQIKLNIRYLIFKLEILHIYTRKKYFYLVMVVEKFEKDNKGKNKEIKYV